MKDMIYRDDAIKLLAEYMREEVLALGYEGVGSVEEYMPDAEAWASDIPAVEPKRGEWISLHNGEWKCSECGIEVLIYAKGNFCPNCGARMKGDNNV